MLGMLVKRLRVKSTISFSSQGAGQHQHGEHAENLGDERERHLVDLSGSLEQTHGKTREQSGDQQGPARNSVTRMPW